MTRVWLCEKPRQAQDLAAVLGSPKKAKGYIETANGIVTWAFGHVLRQAEPEEYDPSFEKWSFATLPIVPSQWKLQPDPEKKSQIAVIRECLKKASEVIVATDAGREGEAIARELLEHCRYRGKVKRLWANALDVASLSKAIANLKDGAATEPLYWAAQARSRGDWVVGMNLTRALTLLSQANGGKGIRSVGRVQTPTLALVVRRDREIAAFKSKDFFVLEAKAQLPDGSTFTLRDSIADSDTRIYEQTAAERFAAIARGWAGPLEVKSDHKNSCPPKLLTLTRLQRLASKQWGWTAAHTLDIAQALYEKHTLVTYPRTECEYLPEEQITGIPNILRALSHIPELVVHCASVALETKIRRSIFNTAKVVEHHAIIPTRVFPELDILSSDELAAYLLIAKHYIAGLAPDHEYIHTKITLNAADIPFSASGRSTLKDGWHSVFGNSEPDTHEEKGPEQTLPKIESGTQVTLIEVNVLKRTTKPPKPYTEGDLIADMENAAKFATDPAIKARLKETSGLGTAATRGEIIKILRDRELLLPKGKYIHASQAAGEILEKLPAALTDPSLTALWEDQLDAIAKGELKVEARDEFVRKIGENVSKLIAQFRTLVLADSGSSKPPTPAMLSFATKIATTLDMELPVEVSTSFLACKDFLAKNSKPIKRP